MRPTRVFQEVLSSIISMNVRAFIRVCFARRPGCDEIPEEMIGSRLSNRYEIVRELGRGGMGVVYLARDPLLSREVAIKVVNPGLFSAEAVERFQREAQTVARMDHPAIAPVYDIGQHEGALYFVMPFLQGANLRAAMADGSLTQGEIMSVGIHVARALEYSHSHGVVHRDVKPENIMFRREAQELQIRVMDFGLATSSSNDRITRSGAIVGTISYLSPEQLSAREIDGRSDIYSLATVLYECLVGETPFIGETHSMLYRIVHENPVSPKSRGIPIHDRLDQIVLMCLEKDPALRPQSAAELAEMLEKHRSGLEAGELAQILTSSKSITTTHALPQLPFVGREKEFSELQNRLNASVAGECQFVLISGEPGIGKSRLLEELERLAQARKIRVLHGRYLQSAETSPYQGYCELIHEYLRTSTAQVDFADLAPDLISLFPVLAEIEKLHTPSPVSIDRILAPARKMEDRTSIFDLLARSFIRIGAGQPLVLFLEDLHSADVSVDALQYIISRLGPTPTLIVGTYRATEVDRAHPLTRLMDNFHGDRRFCVLHLQPLSAQAYRSYLESIIAGGKIDSQISQKLYEATEGNPYFTKELVRTLLDSGGIQRDESGAIRLSGDVRISYEFLPATIQQTVERRIKRLPDRLRQILAIASVSGKAFEFRDLEALSDGAEDLEEAVDQLLQQGFIEEDRRTRGDRFTFSSGVVRDVLYAGLTRRKRRTLHNTFAEALERRHAGQLERVYTQLVHHYSQAEVPEKVIEYGIKFVRRSLDAFSTEDAIRGARTVLEFLEYEEQKKRRLEPEVRVLLSRALRMSGNVGDSLRELEQAIAIMEERKTESPSEAAACLEAIVMAAEQCWESRETEDARRWAEKGLIESRNSGDHGTLTRLLSLSATVANLRGDYEKAREFLREIDQFAGRETAQLPRGGRLVVAYSNPVKADHPVEMHTHEEYELFPNVFETLLATDVLGNLIPGLCETWQALEDGSSFLLTLRKEILLHDGKKLTARDVKRSIESAIRRNPSTLPAAYSVLYGVSEFKEDAADHIAGIVVISDNKLQIQLQDPLPIYPVLLADPRTAVVRESSGSLSPGISRIGTGPFLLSQVGKDRILLKRAPTRSKEEKPYLDEVEFRTGLNAAAIASGFRTGEFDVVRDLPPEDLEAILRDRRLQPRLAEVTQHTTYFVLFNIFNPVPSRFEFRQALNSVIRCHDLVPRTLGRSAQIAEGLFPPGILGYDPGGRRDSISPDRARELLLASGCKLPLRLKASVHPNLQDRYFLLTNELVRVWADLGVEVSIETPDMESFLDSMAENPFDMRLTRWNADYADPDNFTHTLFDSHTGKLRHYFCSPDLDGLMSEARTETHAVLRERLYRKIEDFILNTQALLPLFHEVDYRVAGPTIRQLELRSVVPYVNYADIAKEQDPGPVDHPQKGGILRIPVSGQLANLDPSLFSRVTQGEVLPAIFETLTREVAGAGVTPWLAEFHAENDGKSYRFRLRENARFHNGRRLTSRDVRYSFERLLLNRKSNSRNLLSPISGSKGMLNGDSNHLTGLQIISATEFLILLEEPVSFFPALLAYHAAAIVPEGSAHFTDSWGSGCLGTGPFRVVKFEPDKLLELEANPYYWRPGYPKCEKLIFEIGISPEQIASGFRAGRYSLAWDLTPPDFEALSRDPHHAAGFRETPRLSTYFMCFNCSRGPLSNSSLRRRLRAAVDVDGLVRTLGRIAIPARGIIPPGLPGYSPARQDGIEKVTGKPIELTALINSIFQTSYSGFARDLLAALEENGITVRVLDRELERRVKQDLPVADIFLSRWIADYPDSNNFTYDVFHSRHGQYGNYCGSPEIDALVERARTELDSSVRHQIYAEANRIITEEARLLPLFHEQAYGFAGPKVEGFEVHFSLPYVHFEKLRIRA